MTASTPGPRLARAVDHAVRAHGSQIRKGTGAPYVTHLLAVASLVGEHGGDEDEMIAGLLHDVVEDCGGAPRLEEIRVTFGERVATIVAGCTDDDDTPPGEGKPPWRPRKEAFVASLAGVAPSVLLVVAADKLHNVTDLLAALRDRGEEVWGAFRGGRDGSLWYYRAVLEAIRARKADAEGPGLGRLLARLEDAINRVEAVASGRG